MLFKKQKAILLATGIFIVLIAALTGCGQKTEDAASELKKIPVTVEKAEKGILEKFIALGGLLAPQEEVTLASKNPALKVIAVPVRVGDRVSKGTPMVYFDSRELDLQLEQARVNYERNKQLLEAGAVSPYQLEQMEIALENLKLQKENMTLFSPISGVVAAVGAVEGQLAGSLPLVTVVNIDTLKLLVQVGEANISKLKNGAQMAVSVPAASADLYIGTITTIAPQIDARTKAYPVTLEIINESKAIKGGMYGEVELAVESHEDVLIVPQYAVLDYEQKKIVYVVENDKAVLREIKVGLTIGDKAEIVSGLVPQEMIIVEGQYGVRDGSEVIASVRGE